MTFLCKRDVFEDQYKTNQKLCMTNIAYPEDCRFTEPIQAFESGLILPFIRNHSIRIKLVDSIDNLDKDLVDRNQLSLAFIGGHIHNTLLKISNLPDCTDSTIGLALRSIWFDIMRIMCQEMGDRRFKLGEFPDFMDDENWSLENNLLIEDYLNWRRHDQILTLIPLVLSKHLPIQPDHLIDTFEQDEDKMRIYFLKFYLFVLKNEQKLMRMFMDETG